MNARILGRLEHLYGASGQEAVARWKKPNNVGTCANVSENEEMPVT